jgi:hypothetical protein
MRKRLEVGFCGVEIGERRVGEKPLMPFANVSDSTIPYSMLSFSGLLLLGKVTVLETRP